MDRLIRANLPTRSYTQPQVHSHCALGSYALLSSLYNESAREEADRRKSDAGWAALVK